jgi:hypothetical protein
MIIHKFGGNVSFLKFKKKGKKIAKVFEPIKLSKKLMFKI